MGRFWIFGRRGSRKRPSKHTGTGLGRRRGTSALGLFGRGHRRPRLLRRTRRSRWRRRGINTWRYWPDRHKLLTSSCGGNCPSSAGDRSCFCTSRQTGARQKRAQSCYLLTSPCFPPQYTVQKSCFMHRPPRIFRRTRTMRSNLLSLIVKSLRNPRGSLWHWIDYNPVRVHLQS